MRPVQAIRTGGPVAVASHPRAAAAAARAMAEGGSSVDAAIAGGAVLAAVLPQATALGGDGFMLHRVAEDGSVHALNASGPAPSALRPEHYPDGPAERGPKSVSVPGLVSGWSAAHARFGRSPWAALFEAAVEAAESHPVSPSLARAIEGYRPMLRADPGCRATLLDADGGVPTALRQPALARTLERIAREGAGAFMEDWGAAALGGFVQAAGGLLAPEDLAHYRPEWTPPLLGRYRGHDVALMPPNAYGLMMALQLACLEEIEPGDLRGSREAALAILVDAMRAAFEVGRPLVHDGSTATADDPRLKDALRAALRHPPSGTAAHNRGGTATVSAIDAAGNVTIHILSVYMLFGAGLLDPATGILLHNRMVGFYASADSPTGIMPGRRPPHTLNPALVLQGGEPRLAVATPGGPGQTLTLVQVLSNVLDGGMPLDEAVAVRRWSIDFAGAAILEPDAEGESEMIARRLSDGGRPMAVAAADTPFFGSVEGIAFLPDGTRLAVADGRRDAGVCTAYREDNAP